MGYASELQNNKLPYCCSKSTFQQLTIHEVKGVQFMFHITSRTLTSFGPSLIGLSLWTSSTYLEFSHPVSGLHIFPSPMRPRAMCERGARSPLAPTVPCSGIHGRQLAVNRQMRHPCLTKIYVTSVISTIDRNWWDSWTQTRQPFLRKYQYHYVT